MQFFALVCVLAVLFSMGEARMCGKCDIGNNACCEFTDNLGRLKDQPGYPNCFYKDCFTLGWPGTSRGKNCGKPCECWLNGEKNPCPLDPSAPVYPENLP
ncbi:hypothetical protein AAVH_24664 [Aphelenchoides avenae]|nr:hypothetical protein AAVH_24664 [Aphelenchus avenae]